jgi:hypothetical protein
MVTNCVGRKGGKDSAEITRERSYFTIKSLKLGYLSLGDEEGKKGPSSHLPTPFSLSLVDTK